MAKKVIPGSLTDAYKKREGDFSPDLVGFQFTKSSSLFTFGNFSLTTNLEPLTGQIFNTGEFSDFITLQSLDITNQESVDLFEQSNKFSVTLNFNKKNLLNYVYFSDAKKFLEGEINDLILKWKGSLYLERSTISDTVNDYSFNQIKNTSNFKISVNVLENVFGLITTDTLDPNFDEQDISTISQNFDKYIIENDYGKFNLIGYTGNSTNNDYITVEVLGESWPNLTGNSGSFTYHLRPSDETLDKLFYSKLSDFQRQLMNRDIIPKYTIQVEVPYQNDLGYFYKKVDDYTWPTTDGFNIDISGRNYLEYLNALYSLMTELDSNKTDIMVRRLVAGSILEFDTEGDGTNTTGRKVSKLLRIWGREYDVLKKYIDGISFANVVTYDHQDNTPDELIKMMASNLGFDTIQSFSDNNLINYLVSTTNTVFSGTSKNLSIKELDTELWRRLVINAWWLWKSKGTRKVIEFFLELFQINECLIDLNECVYLVENKLNPVDVFIKLTNYFGDGGFSFGDFPIDGEGYPKILPNTPDYYFQNQGFWYDGGVPNNFKADTNGNNPHFGPYDFGRSYFNKFRCFIDNFEPITTTINLNELTFNYFTDYTLGSVEGTGSETINIDNQSGSVSPDDNILTNYDQFYGGVMNSSGRITSGTTVTQAGSSNEQSNTGTNSFKITISTGNDDSCDFCPTSIIFDNSSGQVQYVSDTDTLTLDDVECCTLFGYDMYFANSSHDQFCYWCPPEDFFVVDDGFDNTNDDNASASKKFSGPFAFFLNPQTTRQILYEKPDGTLATPSKECCELRGYTWNDTTQTCLPRTIVQEPFCPPCGDCGEYVVGNAIEESQGTLTTTVTFSNTSINNISIENQEDCCNYYRDTVDNGYTWDSVNNRCIKQEPTPSDECTFNETNPNSEFSTITNYPEDIFPPGSLGSSAAKQYPISIQNAPCPDTSTGSIPASEAQQFKLEVITPPATIKMETFGGNPTFGNPNDYCIYEPTGDPLFQILTNAGESAGTSFTTLIYSEGSTTPIGEIGGLTNLGSTGEYCFRITGTGTYYIYTQVLPWFRDDNNHSVTVTVE